MGMLVWLLVILLCLLVFGIRFVFFAIVIGVCALLVLILILSKMPTGGYSYNANRIHSGGTVNPSGIYNPWDNSLLVDEPHKARKEK